MEELDQGSVPGRVFEPFVLGEVWVGPVGAVHGDAPDGIELHHAGAFGTGLHPTTRGCAELVWELAPSDRMLDVGSGTGLLALVALRRGCERVTAVEIDPRGRELTRKNAAHNGVGHRLDGPFERLDEVRGSFGLVVANIIDFVSRDLAFPLMERLDRSGHLILGGIRASELDEVQGDFRRLGFGLPRVEQNGEWLTLDFVAPW